MDQQDLEFECVQFSRLDYSVQQQWITQIAEVNLPPLLSELISTHLDLESFSPKELSMLVGRDPVLGAKILAVANAARYGLTTPMTSIQRAMVHLGFNLVKTIMVAYQLESTFLSMADISAEHLAHVRRWSSGASVIAFHLALAADLPDPSTVATAALLGRLGTLMLGLASPAPAEAYRALDDEIARLRFEAATWRITSPALGQVTAQSWGLPNPLPELIAGQWQPLTSGLPAEALARPQALVTAALVLAEHRLRASADTALELLDRPVYSNLKSNLVAHKLLEELHLCWSSARMQRELDGALTD